MEQVVAKVQMQVIMNSMKNQISIEQKFQVGTQMKGTSEENMLVFLS